MDPTFLLTLLFVVIVIGIIVWMGRGALAQIPMDPIFKTIAIGIVALIIVAIVFYYVLFPLVHHLPG